MMQFLINIYILMLSFMFTQMKHPLTMGLILLIQTFLTSLLIGLNYKTFWFSYTLFLIFLGGMLVMFIYVTTLSSNEMFSISIKILLFMMFMLLLMLMIIMILDINYMINLSNYEMFMLNKFNMFMNENSMMLKKIYSYPTNFITLFLINYLFLTLIIAVKITNFFMGPLRTTFN